MREKLTEEFCIETEIPGYHADGGGLYLNVKPDGRKYWCFRWRDRHARYTTEKSKGVGRLREKGLGRFGEHDVSLSDARRLAGECRQLLRRDIDPIARGRGKVGQAVSGSASVLTFGMCAERYIDTHKNEWRNERQAAQWAASLNKHAAPLMNLPVADIDTTLVLFCLEPIWKGKTETATRVRQRIASVLDWAADHKFRRNENPARWRGHLDNLLPQPVKLKKVIRHPALEHRQMGDFMALLRAVDSIAARALELQILAAAYPGEVSGSRWMEFGLKGKVWTIPAERTRRKRERTIPLSIQALGLLKRLPSTDEFVFPGASGEKGISTAAVMKLIKQLRPGITAQGFRETFRNWAVHQPNYRREVVEFALGQQPDASSESANLRSDLISKRARLMQDWANYCDSGR